MLKVFETRKEQSPATQDGVVQMLTQQKIILQSMPRKYKATESFHVCIS